MTATVTLPGVYVHYLEGTEVWEGDDGPASRELGDALRSAPRRKVGKGWNVRVALSRPALHVAREYALDMIETAGIDYESSWPSTGRTVLARVDAALTAQRAASPARKATSTRRSTERRYRMVNDEGDVIHVTGDDVHDARQDGFREA